MFVLIFHLICTPKLVSRKLNEAAVRPAACPKYRKERAAHIYWAYVGYGRSLLCRKSASATLTVDSIDGGYSIT